MRTRAHGLLAGATILAATAGVRAAAPPAVPTSAKQAETLAPARPAEAPGPAGYAAVQPIFTARCVRCHGPEKQKNGLRLDTRSAALEGGIDGPVVIPGDSAKSELVRRILGETKPRMPYRQPPLDAAEIATIRAWIDAGAPGPAVAKTAEATVPAKAEAPPQKHWAYVKPVRPEPPPVKRKEWVKTPIDAFVLARLEHEGLEPSPEATPEILLRRVTLDLTGLPPTTAEIDAFLADTSADAYEKVVDRLLASPHYGERWARPWLDLARYADTNGYEKDRRRTGWKWRDWVITAFNSDMPFRQFTIEQIAGDMLKDAGPDQRIATGFHRNTLLNQEGGIDVEEARWETLVDRVNTTATVWLGTTLACAQCHNHKFDPFTQKDYYRMLAFFDNSEYRVEGEGPKVMDKWIVEPELELATPAQAARKKSLDEETARVQARLAATTPALALAQATWERERSAPPPAWTTLRPTSARSTGGATLEVTDDGIVTASGPNPDRDTYIVGARLPAGRPITAFRIEALAEPPRGTPGRADYGAFVVTRLAVEAASPEGRRRAVPLARAEADSDASAAGLLDRDADTGWGGSDPNHSYTAVVQPTAPVGPGGKVAITLEHQGKQPRNNLRRFRLSVSSSPNPWGGLALPDKIQAIVATPKPQRSEGQRKELAAYYRGLSPSREPDRRKLRELRKALVELGIPTAMTLRERPTGERPSTPLRVRGAFTSPGDRLYAAVPAALHPLPESAMPNRLGLALWLVDENNPLTPRVTVNRIWEQYFGHGLVETSEDFGKQGERPSHPELLDWLATELLRQGTHLKPIHRLIVLSATYRQSSRVTPALREHDPYNRLLARGPRFRIEAEMVRDIALAASGLLSGKVGGPSVFPFQPEGIWDNPYSDDRWQTSAGEDGYRRALYTFARRTAPYPGLTVFDAPSREFCTARRVRTNTPPQALTTLNDPIFFEAARALAARTLKEAAAAPEERAGLAFRLCTARRPQPPELAPLLSFEEQQLARFKADPEAARAVAGAKAPGEAAELAAWTMVANVLLNLDETLTKE